MKNIFLLAVCAFALPLSACKVGPDYQAPDTKVTADFAAAATAKADAKALAAWWATLGDPALTALVEEALVASPDAKLAAAKVKEARAAFEASGGVLWPTVDANGAYARSGTGNGSGGDLFRAGFDAAWEIDVFGGNQRRVESSRNQYEAQVENDRAVRVGLAAEVAAQYVLLANTATRLRIVRANLATQEETLKLAGSRFDAGLSTELPVVQATAQLAGLKVRVAPLEQSLAQSKNTLAILVGRQPQVALQAAEVTGDPAKDIPVGLPSDLLRRRPDVRAAERVLAGATAERGVATAELFPKFALTGNLGHASGRAEDFFDPASRVWSIGPSVSFRLFDRSRVKALVRAADARGDQALAQYEKTVLTALADTENALIACDKGREQFAAQADSVNASERSRALSKELFEKGLGDFLDVLVAERALFDAREQLEVSRAQQTLNLIALYKAVGGGWELP